VIKDRIGRLDEARRNPGAVPAAGFDATHARSAGLPPGLSCAPSGLRLGAAFLLWGGPDRDGCPHLPFRRYALYLQVTGKAPEELFPAVGTDA
jgi:hypothetical protein